LSFPLSLPSLLSFKSLTKELETAYFTHDPYLKISISTLELQETMPFEEVSSTSSSSSSSSGSPVT